MGTSVCDICRLGRGSGPYRRVRAALEDSSEHLKLRLGTPSHTPCGRDSPTQNSTSVLRDSRRGLPEAPSATITLVITLLIARSSARPERRSCVGVGGAAADRPRCAPVNETPARPSVIDPAAVAGPICAASGLPSRSALCVGGAELAVRRGPPRSPDRLW